MIPLGNLDTDQYPPVVGPVVAVVEQGDVPIDVQGLQEIEKSPRTLGELETVDEFVVQAVDPPPDHVADVELGELVVGQVQNGQTRTAQVLDYPLSFGLSTAHLHTDDYRLAIVRSDAEI